ncbi:MAG: hypothetical protein M3346_10595 [Actinomycetota bacterium]|nr:hypothetical protein [Actinomycetota bacterium]
MIKSLFWLMVGAAGALELNRWTSRQKNRLRVSSMTGGLLEVANRRLESNRRTSPPGPGGDPISF